METFNQLSIQITTPEGKIIKINDLKLAQIQFYPDLIPFFTELIQHNADYSNGKIMKLPEIYGKIKTKKCIRQLRELRILRFSRKIGCYVIMDGVYKEFDK